MPADIMYWGRRGSVAATNASGGAAADSAGADAQTYYFLDNGTGGPCKLVAIQPHPTSGPTMHVAFNRAITDATNPDYVIVAGDPPLASPYGLTVTYVSVFFPTAAAKTYGTDFFIRGWL